MPGGEAVLFSSDGECPSEEHVEPLPFRRLHLGSEFVEGPNLETKDPATPALSTRSLSLSLFMCFFGPVHRRSARASCWLWHVMAQSSHRLNNTTPSKWGPQNPQRASSPRLPGHNGNDRRRQFTRQLLLWQSRLHLAFDTRARTCTIVTRLLRSQVDRVNLLLVILWIMGWAAAGSRVFLDPKFLSSCSKNRFCGLHCMGAWTVGHMIRPQSITSSQALRVFGSASLVCHPCRPPQSQYTSRGLCSQATEHKMKHVMNVSLP